MIASWTRPSDPGGAQTTTCSTPATRSARASAAGSAPSAPRSTRTEPPPQVVDRVRLELVGHRVGDEPRGGGGDLLAHHEAVLLQRGARGGEIDDRVHQTGER